MDEFLQKLRAWEVELVADWNKFYTFASVWCMVIMGCLPDIYNAAVAGGLFDGSDAPAALSYGMKIMAVVGVVSRIIKQKAAGVIPNA